LIHTIGNILGKIATPTDSARNDQMRMASSLGRNGVDSGTALQLSRMLAYGHYNQNPQTQAQFLRLLKSSGNLRQQAQ
jgi:hypothetical protein